MAGIVGCGGIANHLVSTFEYFWRSIGFTLVVRRFIGHAFGRASRRGFWFRRRIIKWLHCGRQPGIICDFTHGRRRIVRII